jgi:hypothetical protein
MEPNIQENPLAQSTQPKTLKKKSKMKFIIITVIALAFVIIGGYYLGTQNKNEPKACTMEAKLCPNGSSVGRSGPNCEFAPCPNGTLTPTPKLMGGDKDSHGCLSGAGYSWCELKKKCLRTWEEPCSEGNDMTANWDTYTSSIFGFSIKYPKGWYELENKGIDSFVVFFSPNKLSIVPQSEGPSAPITVVVRKGTLSQIISESEGTSVSTTDDSFLGLPSKIVTGTYNEDSLLPNTSYRRIYFEKNGYTYSIQYLSVTSFSDQDFQVSASTFKFSDNN